jgi:hypothetical protein
VLRALAYHQAGKITGQSVSFEREGRRIVPVAGRPDVGHDHGDGARVLSTLLDGIAEFEARADPRAYGEGAEARGTSSDGMNVACELMPISLGESFL